MPEVLYVISTLAESGPVNQLYSVVSELTDNVSVRILTLSQEPSPSRINEFKSEVELVETLGLGRTESFIKGGWKIQQAVQNMNPDIVHSHGFRADLLSAMFIHNYPTVTTLHTNPRYDYPLSYGRMAGRVMAELHLLAVRRTDITVACSESVAESIKIFGSESTTIRNGIDANKFQPVVDKAPLRRELDLPTNEPIFLSVGRFIERKRPEMVIRSFQQASAKCSLVMIGKGPLLDRCREMSMDSVILPGYVENVRKYFQTVDYFVSASTAEGLPMAVMEALACGLPAVLSNIGPHKEILSINNRAGYLFESSDMMDCSNAIEKMLKQDYERISNAAREVVTKELNAERMGQQYSSLYEKL